MRILRWMSLLLLWSCISEGQTQSPAYSTRNLRSRAMGGVYLPFARGVDASFSNPAALARDREIEIRILEIYAGMNTFLLDNQEDFQSIDPNQPQTLNPFYGERVWLQAGVKGGFSMPGFALTYANDSEVTAELHNPVLPEFETYFRNDEALYMSGAWELGQGLYLGTSVKRLRRWGGHIQNLAVGDIVDAADANAVGQYFDDKGTGFGIDMSLMFVRDTQLNPTFVMAAYDIGSTTFKRNAGTRGITSLGTDFTVGGGISMGEPGLDLQLGFEVRHLQNTEMDLGKKIHVGAEVSLANLSILGGFNQGYMSYGAAVDLWLLSLEAISYTEELGYFPGQSAEPRYMVSLKLDLGFDANFNLTDNAGKKRRLKQRR